MFEKRREVLGAAGVGYLLSGFLLAVMVGGAVYFSQQDPHRLTRNWEQLLAGRARQAAVLALGGLLLFALALSGLFFFQAMAARAARLRSTSGRLAGILLSGSMAALVLLAVWAGVVAPYAALQYQGATDEMQKHALLVEAAVSAHVVMLGFWCFLALLAAGFYFLGRALRDEGGWTSDVLKLAAALIAVHLPTWLYVARESLLNENYLRWLAVADQVMLWGAIATAVFFCARWLRHLGHTLPG